MDKAEGESMLDGLVGVGVRPIFKGQCLAVATKKSHNAEKLHPHQWCRKRSLALMDGGSVAAPNEHGTDRPRWPNQSPSSSPPAAKSREQRTPRQSGVSDKSKSSRRARTGSSTNGIHRLADFMASPRAGPRGM